MPRLFIFINMFSVVEGCGYFTHIVAVCLDTQEKGKTELCCLPLGWSTLRNIISYLLTFCTPIQSPSNQYILHFYLLWKVDIWVSEHLNFKNHSLVTRIKIYLLSPKRLSSFALYYVVCSLFIIFGFCLIAIHFHSSWSALSITYWVGEGVRGRQGTALPMSSISLTRSVTL